MKSHKWPKTIGVMFFNKYTCIQQKCNNCGLNDMAIRDLLKYKDPKATNFEVTIYSPTWSCLQNVSAPPYQICVKRFPCFTNYQRCNAFYLVSILIAGITNIKIQSVIGDKADIFRCEFEV
jgi:hypothetical protein